MLEKHLQDIKTIPFVREKYVYHWNIRRKKNEEFKV